MMASSTREGPANQAVDGANKLRGSERLCALPPAHFPAGRCGVWVQCAHTIVKQGQELKHDV